MLCTSSSNNANTNRRLAPSREPSRVSLPPRTDARRQFRMCAGHPRIDGQDKSGRLQDDACKLDGSPLHWVTSGGGDELTAERGGLGVPTVFLRGRKSVTSQRCRTVLTSSFLSSKVFKFFDFTARKNFYYSTSRNVERYHRTLG